MDGAKLGAALGPVLGQDVVGVALGEPGVTVGPAVVGLALGVPEGCVLVDGTSLGPRLGC